MINKEVSEVLQEQIDKYGQEYDDRGLEALKIAIKIVEQQPCDDCISRAEVLNSLKGFEILHNHDELRSNLIYGIMNLPSVTPQKSWIPCSERLPKLYEEVIVTDIETSDTYVSWYIGNGYWECDNGSFKNRIIAWMPLPEPYKVESEV